MRKVMIGTPCYDGRVDVWYCNSLVETIKKAKELNIEVHPIFVSYDSLVQRARNTIFQMAIVGGYDDLFFIDSDVQWEADWFFNFLNRLEPVIGAALIKKSENEGYTIKLLDRELKYSEDKALIQVDGAGTGFLKISKFALDKIWEVSDKYTSDGKEYRMVCDVHIKWGDLVSEDFMICNKWQDLGYKVWCDPHITINHIGIKKYIGDFKTFLGTTGYK
jgi:hypothetical protein